MDGALVTLLTSKIDALPDEYAAIKHQAKKYLMNNSLIDKAETVKIYHRPWVAPLNWGLFLYKGAASDWIGELSDRTGKAIPDFYGRFLSSINGAFIYDLSLYGISPSMRERNLLDRSVLQCHDLVLANADWISNYNVDPNCFYFGGRHYTYSENIGYFFVEGKIKAIRKNGIIVKEWTQFSDLLNDEIPIAEAMAHKKKPEKKPWWKIW